MRGLSAGGLLNLYISLPTQLMQRMCASLPAIKSDLKVSASIPSEEQLQSELMYKIFNKIKIGGIRRSIDKLYLKLFFDGWFG
jgi:hypothetical protein